MKNRNDRVKSGVQSVKILPRFLLSILIMTALVAPASAIDVSGTLTTGVWRFADSPVRVIGDIEVPAENALTIDPAVRVEFTGPYTLVVRGKLIATGAPDSLIYFTMENGISDSLRWGGIRFLQSENGCLLHFVRIEKGWARGDWPKNCGGGLYAEGCNPVVTRSEIAENQADADGGGFYGWFSNATFRNVLFYDNHAFHYGGGLCFSSSSPQIINCTISLDSALAWGGGIYAGADSKPVIVNSIVARNYQKHELDGVNIDLGDEFTPDFGRAQSARPTVSFSNIGVVPLSPFPGSNNLFLDPDFESITPPYDFHLKYTSPNIDAGDTKYSAAAEPDTLINRIDVGAYGGTEEATPSVPVISVNITDHNFGNYRLNAAVAKEIRIQNRGHYRLNIEELQFGAAGEMIDPTQDWIFTATDSAMAITVTEARINGSLLDSGDVIAVFTPDDTCAGYARMDTAGFPLFIRAWRDNPNTGGREGFRTGETVYYRIWKQATGKYYDAQAQYQTGVGTFNHTSTAEAALDLCFFTDVTEVENEFIPSYRAAPVEPGEQMKLNIYFKPARLQAYRDSVVIVSSDFISPNPTIQLEGTGIDPRALADTALTFPRTAIGNRTVRSLWIRNTGQSDLTVTLKSGISAGYTAEVINETVAPRASGEVRITFAPTLPESFDGSVGFTTNDRDLFVNLHGVGYGPKFVLPDTSARFLGYVYYNGDTIQSAIEIHNDGDENLIINAAQVVDTVAFSPLIPIGGVIIPSRQSGELIVRFHPPRPNEVRNTVLTISSNYPVVRTLRLSGRGMAEPGHYMFGHVSGIWEWSAGHDDYIVLDSVYVPFDQRLKIEAGARILFEPGAAFISDGEVRAVGTEDDSIYFLPRDTSGSQTARWRGVSLSVEDASWLSFCVVKSSRNGIVIRNASPLIEYSTIIDNGDSAATAAGTHRGGAFKFENSGTVVNGCTIDGNFASLGGGFYILNSKPTITNCTIKNNRADDGSAIYLRFLTGGLFQSLIVHNNTAAAGLGTFTAITRSTPRVVNCTIADNTGSAFRALERSLPTVINSIIWGNTGVFELQTGSNVLVTYSDFPGGLAENRNLDVDPLFVGGGSYELADYSTLIDKGNPEAGFRDYFFPPSKMTPRNDLGAYGGPYGGGWTAAGININLFQNPAFPRWCDVIVSGEEAFAAAPVCSVEFFVGSMQPVALEAIDAASYRGSFESPEDGSIFLTTNGQLVSGSPKKVGRTYEVRLTDSNGGTLRLGDLGGDLVIPRRPEAPRRMVIATRGDESIKPDRVLLPISSSVKISGLVGEGSIQIPLTEFGMISDRGVPGIYQSTGNGWTNVASRIEDGLLIAPIKGDGEYILAIGGSEAGDGSIPVTSGLLQAYPNPFNGGVTVAFDLTLASRIALSIHDLTGRRVEVLSAGVFAKGRHEVHWNAESGNGTPLPSGIYWARLETDDNVRSIKLLLVR